MCVCVCVHANTAESEGSAGNISLVLPNKAQTLTGQLPQTLTSSCTCEDRFSHINSEFQIILLECNITSNLSRHLHSCVHCSRFFFCFLKDIRYPLHILSLPVLALPSSFFLLFSSKFSCVIPSPRTPLISPLPACLRSTDKRKRMEERGMAGQRQSEGERNRKQEEKGPEGSKKN